MSRRFRSSHDVALALALLLQLLVCPGAASAPPSRVRLATTTSVENSGLLAAILPAFERSSGVRVDVIPVGSGKALELGRRGDADAVLAHSPEAEERFVREGYGAGRRTIMRNWYLLAGPEDDPAGVRGLGAAEAFRRIAACGARFVSRGDESGTHMKEKEMWGRAGARPAGAAYFEVGSGMAATLMVAFEKQAYTLVDRATYLFLRGRSDLEALVERGDELENRYSVMWVVPAKAAGVPEDGARKLVLWLASALGQRAIGQYHVSGEQVFEPIAGPR